MCKPCEKKMMKILRDYKKGKSKIKGVVTPKRAYAIAMSMRKKRKS